MEETLKNEIDWCRQVIDLRFEQYFCSEDDERKTLDVSLCTPPELDAGSPYGEIVTRMQLGFDERLVLLGEIMAENVPNFINAINPWVQRSSTTQAQEIWRKLHQSTS